MDLFAGAGGMSLGFERAGFDVVAAVELDPIHCAVHEFNFPGCATVCRSVSDIDGDDLRSAAGIGREPVDVVFGGSPCQGFSLIGKRALDDPRNSLVRDFLRIVAELDSNYFVFENVKGLTVGKHVRFLNELVEECGDAGYSVVLPWRILNVSSYGVPQNRERLFLLGAKKGLTLPRYPEPSCAPAIDRQPALDLPAGPSVGAAIGDLPDAEEFEELWQRDWVTAAPGAPSEYAALMRCETRNCWANGYERRFDSSLLTSSMRTDHTDVSRDRFAETASGTTEPVSRFFKLALDGISNTLRAGTASDRGAFTAPRPIHPVFNRCVTVREMARLHSYPDWFRFHATKWHGARQIGNSVPPLLAEAVGRELIRAMGVRPTRPREVLDLGDEALLEMTMAQAARRYGVSPGVIPKRERKTTCSTEHEGEGAEQCPEAGSKQAEMRYG